jgi:hypothetical protein
MNVIKGENMRGGWIGEAVFSNCGRFRYSLLRRWNDAGNAKLINFIMRESSCFGPRTGVILRTRASRFNLPPASICTLLR